MFIQALVLALCLSAVPSGWEAAEGFAERHRDVWNEVFESLDVDTDECEAVIFPELMRYNRVKDGIEHGVLLAPYIKKGVEGADFSVGMFQMKPSFAEQVEEAWMRSGLRHEYGLYFILDDSEDVRRRRVERLGDERWQCVYLGIFVKLMMEREPSLLQMSPEDKVEILATAYNYSFAASLAQLEKRRRQKTFHLDFIKSKKTTCYSYAWLAAKRYNNLKNHKL